MWKTVLRRFLLMIPQLLILSILVFVLAKLMPGDPFTGMITPNTDPKQIEALRVKYGFYDPWHIQYIRWIKNMFNGDFGTSYGFKIPVVDLLGQRIGNTFWLSLFCVTFMYALALPLGIFSGRYSGTKFDKAVTFYNFVTYAIPGFIFYLIMILIFAYTFKIFPSSGSVDAGVTGINYILNRIHHMLLPAICYSLIANVAVVQYLRNEIIDAKSADYVRTARSKGVPINKVYSKHIFRNSLLPIAAFFGFTLTNLISGSVFMETIFSYPGMGKLFVDSVLSRDYSVLTALILIFGFMTLVGSLLSDIIMSIVDPRIRIE
ncbi:MAG: oligopeptide ABC transporter permease [Parvimonas sp.]|uniref:oligopeptide ABC transporter permease n=1 Tax=Parvimonas sp. TaxID=1944660 RepID=UPI0025DEB49E|nr:oligopeptide ABC transporter permease [Parvimonas sp.]MCI5997742.1 ABC transporter permease [Parvimonas sp.]MDY3051162.1 oligopeptide ABC transporter permease [Parvimonas sp.]